MPVTCVSLIMSAQMGSAYVEETLTASGESARIGRSFGLGGRQLLPSLSLYSLRPRVNVRAHIVWYARGRGYTVKLPW